MKNTIFYRMNCYVQNRNWVKTNFDCDIVMVIVGISLQDKIKKLCISTSFALWISTQKIDKKEEEEIIS